MTGEESEKRVPTNLRLLRIMEIVSAARQPVSPTEINRKLGLPKPSIHRLCQTLLDEGYLAREPGSRRLRPARRLRDVAAGILNASDIHIARNQIMQAVAGEIGETVNFVVPEAEGMRYLDRVETAWPLRIQLPIGTHVPFHCTASGKCFLSSMPQASARKMAGALSLSRQTGSTITEPERLIAEIDTIRARGFSTDSQEFMDEMNAVAVPVVSQGGRFVGALAAHGPMSRLSPDRFEAAARTLQSGADQLKESLF
ncbi:MAG: IclR family transcriptional regulator [Pseudomonadota bacterium]